MCKLTLYVKQLCNLLLWSPPNITHFLAISYLEAKQTKQKKTKTQRPNDMRRINTKHLHYNKLLSGEIARLILYQFKLARSARFCCA